MYSAPQKQIKPNDSPTIRPGRSYVIYAYYWTVLATLENTVLACVPISRTVPTTMMRITATMIAYSAMS